LVEAADLLTTGFVAVVDAVFFVGLAAVFAVSRAVVGLLAFFAAAAVPDVPTEAGVAAASVARIESLMMKVLESR
jgi:hypothetical protein